MNDLLAEADMQGEGDVCGLVFCETVNPKAVELMLPSYGMGSR
jgi:hypothetical protein